MSVYSSPGKEGWYRNYARISISPNRYSYGLSEIHYSLNGGEEENYYGRLTIREQGEHTLNWYGVLQDGTHEDTHSETIKIDWESPESDLQMTIINGEEYFTLTGTDSLSGVDRIEYSIWGRGTQTYTEPIPITYKTKYMRYRTIDKAGNAERWQRVNWNNIRRPGTTHGTEGGDPTNGWYNQNILFFLNQMTGYDMANINYSHNGEEWEEYTDSFALTEDGSHTISWRGTRADGTADPVQSAVIKIDTKAPECSRRVTTGEGSGKLELTATDPLSGLLRVEYRVNDGP